MRWGWDGRFIEISPPHFQLIGRVQADHETGSHETGSLGICQSHLNTAITIWHGKGEPWSPGVIHRIVQEFLNQIVFCPIKQSHIDAIVRFTGSLKTYCWTLRCCCVKISKCAFLPFIRFIRTNQVLQQVWCVYVDKMALSPSLISCELMVMVACILYHTHNISLLTWQPIAKGVPFLAFGPTIISELDPPAQATPSFDTSCLIWPV